MRGRQFRIVSCFSLGSAKSYINMPQLMWRPTFGHANTNFLCGSLTIGAPLSGVLEIREIIVGDLHRRSRCLYIIPSSAVKG